MTRPLPINHRRRERGRHWGAVSGVLIGALTIGIGGVSLIRQGPGAVGVCPPPVLRIVVAPDIASLVRRAAESVGGHCAAATVTAQEPAETVRDLKVHPPDVWIPSSTAWLRLAGVGTGSDAYPSPGISLARSPLVVAAPRPVAQSLGWPGRQPSWTELADKTYSGEIAKFSVPDPQRVTSGLLAVLGVDIAAGRAGGGPGAARMRALTFRSRLADANADPARLLRRVTAVRDPAHDVGLFPVTEQALWSNLTDTGARSLVAMYPPDGLVEADYPLVASSGVQHDAARQSMVARLAAWFRSGTGSRTLTERGFRPPVGVGSAPTPAADGLLPRYGPVSPIPADPGVVGTAVATWTRYQQTRLRLLLLVDQSASMGDPVREGANGSTTKAALLRQCGDETARLLDQDTSLAMWLFPPARGSGPPAAEAVPFGPVNEAVGGVPRRTLLGRAFTGYQPTSRAGAPLHEAVLRAEEEMRQRYRPDGITAVVVVTDGPDGGSSSRSSFLARLSADQDPSRPVPVYAIGYGPGADMATLQEAARLTGGQAFAVTDPRELDSAVVAVFLAAHQGRSG